MLGSQTLVNISKEPALCWKLGNPPLHSLEKTYMQHTSACFFFSTIYILASEKNYICIFLFF